MTTVDWTYTAPTDKACWTAMKSYTDDKCTAGEKADGSAIGETGTALKVTTKGSTLYYVVSCEALKMVVYVTTATTDADAKTAYDGAKTDAIDVEYKVVKGSAASECTPWPKGSTDLFAKFTASGYAKPTAAAATNTTNATGAKNLAAAFTAGALAVAATQF